MQTVKIKKTKLIQKLEENLKKHDAVYKEALDAYWIDVAREFDKQAKEAAEMIKMRDMSEGGISLNIHISAPTNNRQAYEEALSMLGYEVDLTVELTHDEFRSYVLNQWSWSDQFLFSNQKYASPETLVAFSSTI